jgi:hypothetical protein
VLTGIPCVCLLLASVVSVVGVVGAARLQIITVIAAHRRALVAHIATVIGIL